MAQFSVNTGELIRSVSLPLDEAGLQAAFGATLPEATGQLRLARSPVSTAVRRLLVLVPDEEVNESRLTQVIWLLAMPYNLEVLLVGTVWQGDAAYTRRRLVSLATQVRDGRVQVETAVYPHKSWLKAIAQTWQPGDLIICHAQQRISIDGWRQQPLANWLLDVHSSPVYILNGFYAHLPLETITLWGKTLSVAVPLLTIFLFALLQAWIGHYRASWLYFPAMILSVLVEIALITAWEGVRN